MSFFSTCEEKALTSFSVKTEPGFFQKLQENSFYYLYRLEKEGHIYERKMTYYSDGRIEYSDVTWFSAPVSVCDTMEKAESAVRTYIQNRCFAYTLVCSPEVYDKLFKQAQMAAIAGSNGISQVDYYGYDFSHVIIVKGMTPADSPWTRVTGDEEFLEALNSYYTSGTQKFMIIAEPA